ncbi:MAG: 3-phosphoshikimate 1-carboxyvinyltransferase, partial [Cyclobacteriaceae bacterium]|nr:3-phosphoshikimate 1-carboxyvinyltransferase [Cyclobacteriaceae bacterium]
GVLLTKKSNLPEMNFDFSDSPDLAQTVIVTCAAKGIPGSFMGLESLKIKETNRITALQNELKKIGASLTETSKGKWKLKPADPENLPVHAVIETYGDHRMAMAFAPLATCMDVTILEPDVVNKSYPAFWEDLQKSGFELKFSRLS